MNVFKGIDFKKFGKKYQGKVRDWYVVDDKRILITTDRISAFDRMLGHIPYKGQVLNQLADFWFEKTKHIIPNHIENIIDPNISIVKNCQPISVEMVVRGYMTGSTVTAIWPSYQRGERVMYGVTFPQGLKKNYKLLQPVITPTYHGDITGKGGHDTRLTKKEIIDLKLVPKNIYEQMEKTVLTLYDFGAKFAFKKGLILVDTKYEFGLINGDLVLMDEIHTPDSSRFWIKKTYKERIKKGLEPENFDKEFLRLWYKERGYMGDGKPPKMTTEFINQVSKRYIKTYELLAGKKFLYPKGSVIQRIKTNLKNYFKPKIAVLISNKGMATNLQAIINGIERKNINAKLSVVISDEINAYGLIRAKKHKIPTILCLKKESLLKILQKYSIDYVALAGWKQFLTQEVMNTYKNRILNLHPGLIPDSLNEAVKNPDGTPALWNKKKFTDKAIQKFLDNKSTYAGSTIHFLSDEVDFGPVLGRTFEKIKKNDTIETLYKRLKKKENSLYANVLQKLTNRKTL